MEHEGEKLIFPGPFLGATSVGFNLKQLRGKSREKGG